MTSASSRKAQRCAATRGLGCWGGGQHTGSAQQPDRPAAGMQACSQAGDRTSSTSQPRQSDSQGGVCAFSRPEAAATEPSRGGRCPGCSPLLLLGALELGAINPSRKRASGSLHIPPMGCQHPVPRTRIRLAVEVTKPSGAFLSPSPRALHTLLVPPHRGVSHPSRQRGACTSSTMNKATAEAPNSFPSCPASPQHTSEHVQEQQQGIPMLLHAAAGAGMQDVGGWWSHTSPVLEPAWPQGSLAPAGINYSLLLPPMAAFREMKAVASVVLERL